MAAVMSHRKSLHAEQRKKKRGVQWYGAVENFKGRL
jgi:hypothetical protein